MLLPFQGASLQILITQGDALGYVLLPFQGAMIAFIIFLPIASVEKVVGAVN